MNRGFSLWLDVLRVMATLIVVLSHWAYERFTRGDYLWIRDLNLGSDAVILFFVISGIVIAFAAERDGSLPRYAFNRLTRLWSVMVPALALTLVFDRIGAGLDPSAYPPGYYNPIPASVMLLRGLSFSSEWLLFGPVRLGSNGPLWSLSYEAGYYLLFGAVIFLHGARRVLVLLILILLIGPLPLLLIPSWLIGVTIWRRVSREGRLGLTVWQAWICALAGPALYSLCLFAALPIYLQELSGSLVPNYAGLLRYSDEFIWNALTGILTGLHLLGMARLLGVGFQGERVIRWLAGASFSIYVTHYPALQLLNVVLPFQGLLHDAVLLIATLAIGLAVASLFERRIGAIRVGLRRLMGSEQIKTI